MERAFPEKNFPKFFGKWKTPNLVKIIAECKEDMLEVVATQDA